MKPEEFGKKVALEVQDALARIQDGQVDRFVQEILQTERVFLYGFGRILLMMKAFAMRLVHLGIEAHVIGDVTTPGVRTGDLIIMGSASGETEMTYLVARKSKSLGARTATITANSRSRIATACDVCVEIRAQAKSEVGEAASSIQPMATLFEQCMLLLFDVVALVIMEKKGITAKEMLSRHSNLE